MKILAIETSHDDTSVVIYENKKILYEFAFTQAEFHQKFGGTVPEYAARCHFIRLLETLKLLKTQKLLKNINLIAYTSHPGLIGSLQTGAVFAKALALALNLPLIPINHMHGHIFAAAFTNEIKFPAIALIISGGHSQIWKVYSYHKLQLLGETKDDAIGEVFDKISRKMKLGYPGGPIIDKIAKQGKPIYNFKIKDDRTYNMSFSGLKTKIINKIDDLIAQKEQNFEKDIACSFQTAIVNLFESKVKRAIEEHQPHSIILGGGVSANSKIRSDFVKWHKNAFLPGMKYTTDNAMMIAITSHLQATNKN